MKNGRTDVLKQASKRKKEYRQDHPGRAFERVLAKRKGGPCLLSLGLLTRYST